MSIRPTSGPSFIKIGRPTFSTSGTLSQTMTLKLQLQNRTCKPGAIFSAICRRDIAGVSNMFETCCSFSATKIASGCRDINRLCKRALKVRLHRQFLSRQLDAIFVALKLQLQNRTCKPGAIFSAICRRDIAARWSVARAFSPALSKTKVLN